MAIVRLEDPDNPTSLRIVAVNPAAAHASDVPTAAVGKRLDQDFPEIVRTAFAALVGEVMQSGVPKDLGEGPGVYSPDRHFMVKAFPVAPACVGLIFDDITERKKSERAQRESEQRYSKIFDASPTAICVFDPDTTALIDVNPRFVDLLGHGSSAQLIGKPLETFGIWTGDGEYRRLLNDLRESRSLRETSVTYRTYGGQVRRGLVALELIEIEGRECVLGIIWRV